MSPQLLLTAIYLACSLAVADLTQSQEGFRFLSKSTQPFLVEELPEIDFILGEIYSGFIPIDSRRENETRALFFIFQPTIADEPVDEITIWLNGGPGCSSLEGFLQENGRFVWQPSTFRPVENPYSWVNLTNMLWVDQPIGTGFSIDTPTAVRQEETAQDFIKFLKNFQELFEIRNFKIYITGESYAGRFIPYISAAMLDENDTGFFDIRGAILYDPNIGEFQYVQQQVPMAPFVQANANAFNFNQTFMEELKNVHQSCRYADYIEHYLVFPAEEVQPPNSYNFSSCDIFDLAITAVLSINPCFDIYEITSMCPIPWDVLGSPTMLNIIPAGAQVYFDRDDVKRALHAPLNVTWTECSEQAIYIGEGGNAGPEQKGDEAADPIQHVLPRLIEATNRVLIANGDYDMIIQTNGTLISIQNMTWNGKLGFEHRPSQPIVIDIPDLAYAAQYAQAGLAGLDGPQQSMGIQHYERGLMWAETFQCGHMQPQYQPRVAYRHLQWLLGHIDML